MGLKLDLPKRDFKKEWNELPKGTMIHITGVKHEENKDLIGHVVVKVECKDKAGFFSEACHQENEDPFQVVAISLKDLSEWLTPFQFEDGDLIWEVIPDGTKITVVQPKKD